MLQSDVECKRKAAAKSRRLQLWKRIELVLKVAVPRILAVALAGLALVSLACDSGPTHTPDPSRVVHLTEQQMKAVLLTPEEVEAEFTDLNFVEVDSGPLPILLTDNPRIELRNYQTPTPIPRWQGGYAHSFGGSFFFPDEDDEVYQIISRIDVLDSSEATTLFIDAQVAQAIERMSVENGNVKYHSIENLDSTQGIGEVFGGYRAKMDIPGQELYLQKYRWYWKRGNIVLSVYLQGVASMDHEPTVARLAGEMDVRLAAVTPHE